MSKSLRLELSELDYDQKMNVVTVRGNAQIARNQFTFVYVLHSNLSESVIYPPKFASMLSHYSTGKQKKFAVQIKNKCRDTAIKAKQYATT